MNPQIIYTRPASDLQTVVTLHLEGRELVRRDASGVRRSSATVSNILPIAELCATGHHPRAALDPFARRDHVNIRHISIQRDHMGQEIERLELEGEARTLEELEASFKQLPQTPLVKSWSAAVTSELKEQLTPDAWVALGLQADEAPHSSQSTGSEL